MNLLGKFLYLANEREIHQRDELLVKKRQVKQKINCVTR
jgi:hypothetical protein